MKKSYLILHALALAAGLVLSGAPLVFAQQEEFTLEEITVTAEKRSENLQKISMSIAVVPGEDLVNQGAVSLHDVLKGIANVSTTDTGGMGATINIRGLGQDLPIGVGESSVSTNYDGAFQMRSEANMFGYFDVDRVEVLRGPQGTLYGRNATGGVVNIVSKRPTTERVEGYASLEMANYDKLKTEAAVNVPISDIFAGRLAFVTTKGDSYTVDDMGGRDSTQGMATRLQLSYMPSADVSLNLQYNYVYRTGRMSGEVSNVNWDAGNYDQNNNDAPLSRTNKSEYTSQKFALTADFPLGPGQVTFLPTYENIWARSSGYSVPRGPGVPPGSDPTFNQGGMPWDNVTKTVELRYANKTGSRVTWVGGVYWSDTDEPQVPRTPEYTTNPGEDAYKWYETYAAFGQMTFPFTDRLRVIAGARYNIDKKGYFDDRFPTQDPPAPAENSFEFSYFDWKAGIERDFSQDVMGYFTLATGHKPGGFAEQTGIPFEMESAISGELGVKSRLMDNRLQINGDIFYYDYEGYQVVDVYWVVNELYPDGGMYANFFNADSAVNYGAEIETTALVGSATELSLAVAYLQNEYTADFYVHGDPFAPPVNQNGMPLPHSPEFTFNAGINHTFSFGEGSTLRPSVTYRWVDEQYLGVLVSPDWLGPAYAVMDVMLTYVAPKNWSLNFYCNNALDEHYYTGSVPQGPTNAYFPGAPRTAGLVLNVSF